MRYLIAAHTDVGIKKKTNQDSYMIKEAQTKMGRIFFGVLCDGMGGLSNGELASATVIRAMEQWFETDFPQLLVHGIHTKENKRAYRKSRGLRGETDLCGCGRRISGCSGI